MSNDSVLRISCEELKQLIDAEERIVIIDTRESTEYSAGHIHGAINIHYSVLGDPMGRELMLSALPGDTLLVPYCS